MRDKTLKKDKTPEQALNRLMALCARSEKSSGDALRLMRGWGLDASQREDVLRRLVRERFIDDSRYAAAYVREKMKFSGWGAYKIRSALAAKGVARDIIDDALSQVDADSLTSRLDKYLRAKASKLTGTPYEIKAKLIRYGASLGYDYQTVIDRVERIIE